MKYERLTQAQKDRCVRCGQYIYNLSMTIR